MFYFYFYFFWGGAWPTANFTVSTIEKWHLNKWCIFFRCFFGILSNESINKSMNHICSNVMECLPIHFPNNLNQPDIGNYSSSIGAWWKIPTKQTTIISENISFKEITVQQPAVFFPKGSGFHREFYPHLPLLARYLASMQGLGDVLGKMFFGCSRKAGIYLKSIWIILNR